MVTRGCDCNSGGDDVNGGVGCGGSGGKGGVEMACDGWPESSRKGWSDAGKEDQEGNNSPKIETLHLFPIHGGSQHDFFGVKASNLSSDHSVGGYYTARMVGPYMDITTDFNQREEEDQEGNNSLKIETLPLFPIHGGSQHAFFGVKASDLSSDHSVGGYYTARKVGPHMDIKTDF
ncbi:hypothetical protein Tco_0205673, partial [Tanacetum coccineum]